MIDHQWLAAVTNEQPLFFILGLCALENEQHTLESALFLKSLSEKLSFRLIFKAAFDKANRTALSGYRGLGLAEGLAILKKVKQKTGLPIITDVHETWQIEPVALVADVIQIPAFLCRQTDLLIAAGATDKPVMIKKGQFVTPESMRHAVDKVASTGNHKAWLCERGFTFGYNNLVVDYRSFPIMKSIGKPVVFDATHSVQRPGGLGNATAGDRHFVASLAAAAVTQRIAGIFMETHEHPERALSDGPNSIRYSNLESLLSYLIDLDAWVKSRPEPQTP